jgi:hypothetical protein
MDAEDLTTEIESWEVNGTRPNLGSRTKVKLAIHGMRIASGTAYRREEIQKWDAEREANRLEEVRLQSLASQKQNAPPSASQSSSSALPNHLGLLTVRVRDIADPSNRQEIQSMVSEELDPYIARYKKLMWEEPKPCVEPTCDQVAVLRHLINSGQSPFVDFAIWGPYNDRFQRSQMFSGLEVGSDGNLHKIEVRGPATLDLWCEAYDVFASAMLMLGASMPPTIFGYRDFIKTKVKEHGAVCWAVIYQAEVRMRREHLSRIRRTTSQALQKALEKNSNAVITDANGNEFDPSMPWEFCIRQAFEEQDKFWSSNVVTPCIQVTAKIKHPNEFLEGDANISDPNASGSNPRIKVKKDITKQNQEIAKLLKAQKGGKGNKKGGKQHVERSLCRMYNLGKCTGNGKDCPTDPTNRYHGCSIRQQTGHPAISCPSLKKGGKGSGKGGGKGGGKKDQAKKVKIDPNA